MAQDWNPQVCEETLKKAGLEPIFPGVHCEDFESLIHEECAKSPQSPYMPVQVLGCYNPKSSEWCFFPPEQLLEEYEKLVKGEPNWELRNCYCCC
jgi:hypothetical protein